MTSIESIAENIIKNIRRWRIRAINLAVVAAFSLGIPAEYAVAAEPPVAAASSSSRSKSRKKSSRKSSKKSRNKSSGKKTKVTKEKRSWRRSGSRGSVSGSTTVVTVEQQQPARLPGSRSLAETPETPAPRGGENPRKIKVVKPDLNEIRTSTLDPKSKYYFPKLKAKYEVNDTTMTNDEFRHLYLGYMFQEDFDPYRMSPYAEKTKDLRSKATHTREEIDTIIKYAQLSLEDNPFDLRQMSFLIHVLKERRKDMRAKIWEYRLEHLLGAIKSTGTGEDQDNAWYVIYPMHEYDMVQLLGYEATGAEFIDPGYDYLTVQKNPDDKRKVKDVKGFYFNIVVPSEQYVLKHPEDAEANEEEEAAPAPETPAQTAPAQAAPAESEEEIDPDDIPAE